MCELGIRKEKVREHFLGAALSIHWEQVLFHGNLLTKRDMTDVADSSRVMVDLIEVFPALLYRIMNIADSDKLSFRLPRQGQCTTCVATELFR